MSPTMHNRINLPDLCMNEKCFLSHMLWGSTLLLVSTSQEQNTRIC